MRQPQMPPGLTRDERDYWQGEQNAARELSHAVRLECRVETMTCPWCKGIGVDEGCRHCDGTGEVETG